MGERRIESVEMQKILEITTSMSRISELLRAGGEENWAARIERYRLALPGDTLETLSKIAVLYGGMGSLSDIVLYRNGQPLLSENDELHELRSKLFTLCREL